MQTVKAISKVYTLYSVTGKVAATSKNLETTISGSGGGGYTSRGTGYTAPVSISSKTTVHDNIFLLDNTGNEHSFQLQDFNVACREGNELKVIWAIKTGKKNGEYFAVRNRTTGNNFFNTGALRRMFKPPWIYPLALTLIFLYIGSGTSIFLAFATWIAYVIYTIQKAEAFKKSFDPEAVS